MVVHIWKVRCRSGTLILLAGRLAIPGELYEARVGRRRGGMASLPLHHLAVDQHRFYVTCTFPLDDSSRSATSTASIC